MSFRSRAAAEQVSAYMSIVSSVMLTFVRPALRVSLQGLAKGTHMATVGAVQVSWFSGQAAARTLPHAPRSASAPSTSEPHKDVAIVDVPPDDSDSHVHHEEVGPDTGGWGGDDDGFGMM